jgi:hypothetical protein
MWRFAFTIALILSSRVVLGGEYQAVPPQGGPAFQQPALGQAQPATPYELAWPPPGQDVPRGAGAAIPPTLPATATIINAPAPTEIPISSTWYFRQESFHWNERIGSEDFVNEYGPLSTLGYARRYGIERYRLEMFGGTMAYYGGAQFPDGTVEPYNQSFGTNYLGFRGEYDLLIEPASWERIRMLLGVGTRFWFRDLRDAVTPSGADVMGYQETWWTFYPYFGLETKETEGPGPQFYGSSRIGFTPLTYQYATYFDTTAYPRCGLTGQAELGVRFRKFSLAAYLELMTWGASAMGRDSYQPASEMFTFGGKLGYTF